MADEQAKSLPPVVVVDQHETPSEKNEKGQNKGQMSIVPSVVSGKPAVRSHHASVHRSEAIELTTLQIEKKRGVIIPSSQPIPADVKSVHSSDSELNQDKHTTGDKKQVNDNEKKEKHAKIDDKQMEWSDDEEACGLPRCESRASRVSRVVQKMFCCGVTYEAPSDEDMSSPRRHYGNAI